VRTNLVTHLLHSEFGHEVLNAEFMR
jgi:hypothetical protein